MTTLQQIRKELDYERSPRDKGWILTIKVGAYDDGIVSINGRPTGDPDPSGSGWLAAGVDLAQHLHEFHQTVRREQAKR